MLIRHACAAALLMVLPACIPYTVGSTAQTVKPGEIVQNTSMYAIPNGIALDSTRGSSHGLRGMDAEIRFGIDRRTDVGLRIPSASGFVLDVKRRFGGDTAGTRPAVALSGGAGIVNFGDHALAELTMIASGAQDGSITPYGGAHVLQVAPLSSGAVHDAPTAGLFAGVRVGDGRIAFSPEIGVYYDPSALHIRRGNFIVVPSVTINRTR